MKAIVFDSGPIISLSLNNLLWILEKLKAKYNGYFLISPKVKEELVDVPITRTRRYILEGLNVLNLILKGIINIGNYDFKDLYEKIDHFANKIFSSGDAYINIIHSGEIETLCLCLKAKAEAIVIDERNTRLLIEDPIKLKERLERKLHRRIKVDEYRLKELKELFKNIKVIRSAELVSVAYELNIFKEYYVSEIKEFDENFDYDLLKGLLWGVKLKGCSISEEEINRIIEKVIKKVK